MFDSELCSKLKRINKELKLNLHFSGYPLARQLLNLPNNELEVKYRFKENLFKTFLVKLSDISNDIFVEEPFYEVTVFISNMKLKFVPFFRFRYVKGIPVKIINNSKNNLTSLLIDSNHRGVTINSLFYCIENDRLKDFSGGLKDLNKELIVNWSPKKRLLEDPTRFIKTFAYAAELNKNVGKKYFEAMKQYHHLFRINNNRDVRKWLNKILLSSKPSKYINGLFKTKILQYILPFLAQCYGVQQNEYHKYDVYTHCLLTCDNTPPDLALRFAGLLHDVGKVSTKKIIDSKVTFHSHEVIGSFMARDMLASLGYGPIAEEVATLVREHMYNYTKNWTDKTLLKLIRKLGITNETSIKTVKLFKLRAADRLGKGLTEPVTQKQLDLEERIAKLLKETIKE